MKPFLRASISRLTLLLAVFFTTLPLVAAETAGTSPAKLKVVCFGDSITKSVGHPDDQTYPALLGRKLGIEVINAGVGGNTTTAGLARMEKDVLAHKPDAVVIFFGTNDSVLTAAKKYKTPLADYVANLKKMVERCRQQQAKAVLCTLPPINAEPYFQRHPKAEYEAEGGLEQILARYRDAVVELGKELKVPVVDLNQKLDKAAALRADGVHMNDKGCDLIAGLVSEVLGPELGLPKKN